MKRLARIAAAAAIALGAGTMTATAACNGDASTETALGAGSGALVGGLASHSLVGAAVGGVAGGDDVIEAEVVKMARAQGDRMRNLKPVLERSQQTLRTFYDRL